MSQGTHGCRKDTVLGQFARGRDQAIARYKAFVREGTSQSSPWEEGLRQQIYLGDEAFVSRMQARLEEADLEEVPRAQRCPPALPLAAYAQRYPERRTVSRALRRGEELSP